jgi:hypothetical protein
VLNGSGPDIGIEGNAFAGWGEPGVVWVSRDDNGNGIADDTWYELKGGEEGKKNFSITYYRPESGNSGIFKDNAGVSYAYPQRFPYRDGAQYFTFTGTLIENDSSLGFVDSFTIHFDIGDAIQRDGTPINLDYIDFVKVQCGMNRMAGVLGEVSTETGVPYDISIPSPDYLLQGRPAGSAYAYEFVNNSGYDLTVNLGGQSRSLKAASSVTITLNVSEAYFFATGGNYAFTRETGKVTFSDR